MTDFDADHARALLADVADFGDTRLHTDYSGRAMYGRTCYGLSGDPTDILYDLAQLLNLDDDDDTVAYLLDMDNQRTDSLGLRTIIYWPGIAGTPACFYCGEPAATPPGAPDPMCQDCADAADPDPDDREADYWDLTDQATNPL